MSSNILNALRGIGGEYELNRLVGAFGGVAYVVGANAFVGWDTMVKGREFDITAYCLAFPGGLAVAVGAIAGAVAWKDKAVESAKVIRDTGAPPPRAAAGASSAPQQVEVVNTTAQPVPVEPQP